MNPLRAFVRLRALPLAQRQLLFFAAIVAVALLSLYVQLLHQSLARGDELRELQRSAGIRKPAKAAAPSTPPGPVRARAGADSTDTGAR
jgi:hypothetical protein